jgi:hypothetical protein
MKLAVAILFTALIGIGGYLAIQALYPPAAPEREAVPTVVPTPEPEVAVVPRPEPPRPLAITGWVYKDLVPAAGAVVAIGEENVTAGTDGSFAFPPAVRDRTVKAMVRGADGAAGEWDGLVAGDAREEAPDGGAAEGTDGTAPAVDPLLPARPERLHWTFNLSLRAEDHDWLRARDAAIEVWGSGARVRARAETKLPDGARIASSFYFDGLRFMASLEPAVAKEGACTAVISAPSGTKVFSGEYDFQLVFESVLQDRERRDEWKAARPEVDWEALSVPEARARIFIGSVQEAREEDAAVRDYYARTLAEARGLRRALRSRVDEVRLAGKGWDPAILAARGRAREGWFEDPLVDTSGRFLVEKWRGFLDGWRGRVRALRESHAARGAEKYPEAARMLDLLLLAVLQESYVFSRFTVYPLFALAPHPDDEYLDDYLGDLRRLDSLIEGNGQALERYTRLGEE